MYETSNEMANSLQSINTSDSSFKMATVTQVNGEKVFLTFYGEATQRTKSYKRLASYSPTVGDSVLVAIINNTYTILGKVV